MRNLSSLLTAGSLYLAAVAAVGAPQAKATTTLPVAQAAPVAIAPELREDPRLQVQLSLAEANRPMGELLAELGRKHSVRLLARREVADDKTTLFLDERPAAEALSLLARHHEFQWYRTATGYELGQAPAAIRRETALRDREWNAVDGWMEHLRQLSRTPSDQLGRRQREVERALAQPGIASEQSLALLEEQSALKDILRHSTAVPVALEIYRTLTPLQRRQLRTTGSVRLSSAFGGIAPKWIGAAMIALKQPYLKPDQPIWVDMVLRMTDASRDYNTGGARTPRQLRLNAFLTVATEHGSSMVNMAPRSLVRVPLPWIGPESPARPSDPDLSAEFSLKLPPVEKPTGHAPVVLDRLAEWNAGTLSIGEVARQLQVATGLDVVADSFIRARVRAAEFSGKGTVRAFLDRLAADLGYAWWKEGRTLHLRDRSFHNDRPAEVPERILRPWRERVRVKTAPTLDDLGDLAVRLTEPQARGVHDYWGWYLGSTSIPSPSFSGGFFRLRHDLRFWGSLDRRQKTWVLAGNRLLAGNMAFHQRLHFLRALTEPTDGDWTGREIRAIPPCPPVPSSATVPATAAFKLTEREVEIQVFADEKGQHLATIVTLGAGRHGIPFGRRNQQVPVGPPSRAQSLSLNYVLNAGGAVTRANQLYVFTADEVAPAPGLPLLPAPN